MNRGDKISVSSTAKITLIVLLIALLSLACSFSVGDPGNSPTFPNQSPLPTRPSAQQATQENEDTAPIPQTGDENTAPNQGSGQSGASPEIGNLGTVSQTAPGSLAELYNQSNPGAVAISVTVSEGGQVGQGAGSGFIITDTGYIATNDHVVEGASQVYVSFFNQIILPAQVVGADPNSDLAIIKVDQLPPDTHPLPLGDSDQVQVGEEVVAIGNPFGIGTSMTYGIVSALGRVIPALTDYTIPKAIQTDAAINPGNSGGPLINMRGEVIGINAQIQTGGQSQGNVGVGFAIPVNILKLVYQDLINTGNFTWPYLGVQGGTITPDATQQLNLDPNQRGAYIAGVTSRGPSAQAGLQEGDVIIQVDDQVVNTFDDLLTYVAFKRPGDQVTLTVLRNGQQSQIQVVLGERPTTSLSNP